MVARRRKHLNIGGSVAKIIGLDVDQRAAIPFAAEVGMRRNSSVGRRMQRFVKGKECAYCSNPADQAHHIFPAWLFPWLEGDSRYWLPVCRSHKNHHLNAAHLGDFNLFDILARPHAEIFKTCSRLSGFFVKLVHLAEKRPALRRELEALLRELTGATA